MENTFFEFPEPNTEAEAQAVIEQVFSEIYRLNETMRQDQIVIDQIKIETLRLKAETRATLDRICFESTKVDFALS